MPTPGGGEKSPRGITPPWVAAGAGEAAADPVPAGAAAPDRLPGWGEGALGSGLPGMKPPGRNAGPAGCNGIPPEDENEPVPEEYSIRSELGLTRLWMM